MGSAYCLSFGLLDFDLLVTLIGLIGFLFATTLVLVFLLGIL